MTIDDRIRDERLQHNKVEATKISALSSGKLDKYEFVTSEEKLPSDQSRTIKQAKSTYSHTGKALKNK